MRLILLLISCFGLGIHISCASNYPAKIVSLAPSITEIVFALGIGDQVVGVTSFSNYPSEAKRLTKIGTYTHLNVEKIIQLEPDIAIGTYDGNREMDIKILKEAGIKVYMTNPKNLLDVINTIYKISQILNVPERGMAIKRSLKARIENVVKKVANLKKIRVFLQINNWPIITINKNTFQNDLIKLAGGVNIAENEPIRYPRMSIEEIIYRKPQVIIISSMEKGGKFEQMRHEWMRWKNIPAVKSGRIYLVNSDLLDRPSPRLVDGLEVLARLIHPEAGWK